MKYFLIVLMVFLGLGASTGGLLMILDPSGHLLGMPLSVIEPSPFRDFLIPGLILFLVLGVMSLLVSIGLLRESKSKLAEQFNCFNDMQWSWSYAIYMAFTLIIWIQIQIILIDDISWLHTFYTFLALLILFVSLHPKLRDNYRKIKH